MVTELQVSGAFHSPLMNSASEELGKAIDSVQFHNPIKPVYPNVTGKPVSDPSELKTLLLDQLTSPVLWAQTLQTMHQNGIVSFKEVGPGKVLQGLVKRTITDSSLVIGGIDTSLDIKSILEIGE